MVLRQTNKDGLLAESESKKKRRLRSRKTDGQAAAPMSSDDLLEISSGVSAQTFGQAAAKHHVSKRTVSRAVSTTAHAQMLSQEVLMVAAMQTLERQAPDWAVLVPNVGRNEIKIAFHSGHVQREAHDFAIHGCDGL